MISKQEFNDTESFTLQIKEEQLDIAKKWIQTGDVNIYKKTFLLEKSFTIPVKCEELVIEKKDLSSANAEANDVSTEVIRIPLSEEHVEFTKQTVALEEVSIYKEKIEDIKHIEETLKKEKPHINMLGSLNEKKK